MISMPRGHFNHKGRIGEVGGSLPKGQVNLANLFRVLKGGPNSGNHGHAGRLGHRGGSSPNKVNSIAAGWMSQIRGIADSLHVDEVKHWFSLDGDGKMDLYHDDKDRYERLKTLTDEFKKFQIDQNHPLREVISQGQIKEVLNRMTQPDLSDKDLSKLPTKDNYRAWMFQKYGVVADNLSGENAKRYGEALNDINAKHGIVGGFFLKGVDAAWQKQGERGGDFDSAYQTIHVPNRLGQGGQPQDAKNVLIHEYAHYLDGYVLGKPTIVNLKANSSKGGKNVIVMRKDSREEWLTSQYAANLGYSKEQKEGYAKYDYFEAKTTPWYRDPSKINNLGYKDYSPHELLATMYTDHINGKLGSSNYYSKDELSWFNDKVLPHL